MDRSPHTSDFVNANGINLHYLDWGGSGDVLLFLAGMGCSVHIFDGFAPRFVDAFHVLAMDRRGHGDSDYPDTGYDPDTLTEDLRKFLDALKIDKVILAGRSLAYIELSRFTVLYPERVLKLIFLDSAYDSSAPEYKAVFEKNPMPKMMPAWPEDNFDTVEEYIATVKRLYPSLAVIWGEVMEGQTKHTVRATSEGKILDKMSEAEFKALNNTVSSYVPEYSKIQAPTLSFFTLQDGSASNSSSSSSSSSSSRSSSSRSSSSRSSSSPRPHGLLRIHDRLLDQSRRSTRARRAQTEHSNPDRRQRRSPILVPILARQGHDSHHPPTRFVLSLPVS